MTRTRNRIGAADETRLLAAHDDKFIWAVRSIEVILGLQLFCKLNTSAFAIGAKEATSCIVQCELLRGLSWPRGSNNRKTWAAGGDIRGRCARFCLCNNSNRVDILGNADGGTSDRIAIVIVFLSHILFVDSFDGPMFLSVNDCVTHRLYRLHRIRSVREVSSESMTTSAARDNCSRNITHFCARRFWIVDHATEHLSRDNAEFSGYLRHSAMICRCTTGTTSEPATREVATRYHDRIACLDVRSSMSPAMAERVPIFDMICASDLY